MTTRRRGDIVSKLHRILHPFMLRRLKRCSEIFPARPNRDVRGYDGRTTRALSSDCEGYGRSAKQLREANCRGAGGGSLLNKLMQPKVLQSSYLFANGRDG